ncbi:GntR family transcriptional regulator [Streptomyces albidocamelliae]|uniref:GntR family transcriptional regulator n=1 Tax=Streptomyces albidocamelliae TaxID=2981135 RepID=A0ABY6EPE7_9ACTN|nr:GntR family transcriptional regulator [Streptomyces sp. HUAS 14-6]UXY36128.1 GntR family transcriptional regulator [Streptomyces sp. HUAS 14-6]
MSQAASPRGTFRQIADVLKTRINDDQEMAVLPPVSDLMDRYGVSRGVVLRAFQLLRSSGDAEPVPGGRWRVLRSGDVVDRRPLEERIAAVITDDRLEAGAPFPSASALATRFGVSRPTVTKALDKLEAAGMLASGGQGKVRTVRAVPNREERS